MLWDTPRNTEHSRGITFGHTSDTCTEYPRTPFVENTGTSVFPGVAFVVLGGGVDWVRTNPRRPFGPCLGVSPQPASLKLCVAAELLRGKCLYSRPDRGPDLCHIAQLLSEGTQPLGGVDQVVGGTRVRCAGRSGGAHRADDPLDAVEPVPEIVHRHIGERGVEETRELTLAWLPRES